MIAAAPRRGQNGSSALLMAVPPQAAILGLGRARRRPAVVDGAIEARTLVVLSLTFDHRAVDGVPAAAFLDQVIAALEDASRLI